MTDTPKQWRVEVVEDATQEVVKTIQCHTQREAERVERGLSINMNHADYYTEIEQPKDQHD